MHSGIGLIYAVKRHGVDSCGPRDVGVFLPLRVIQAGRRGGLQRGCCLLSRPLGTCVAEPLLRGEESQKL